MYRTVRNIGDLPMGGAPLCATFFTFSPKTDPKTGNIYLHFSQRRTLRRATFSTILPKTDPKTDPKTAEFPTNLPKTDPKTGTGVTYPGIPTGVQVSHTRVYLGVYIA